jgi:PST family polysaccharide transporter
MKWKIEIKTMKDLMKDSWPLMLSTFAILLYTRIGSIMVGQFLSYNDLGIFSPAVKLSEAWYFFPMILANSVFPSILKAKKIDRHLYLDRIQKLYNFFTWFSLFIAIIITFSSKLIIRILFGIEFIQAATILSILIWAGYFVCIGVVSGKYFASENLTKISFYRTSIGAISNILLNFYLIKNYGIIGAAWASLLTNFIATFSFMLFRDARPQLKMVLRSFIFPIEFVKTLLKKYTKTKGKPNFIVENKEN